LAGEFFAPTLAWITYVISEASFLRTAVPDFMTKIIEEEGKLTAPFLFFMKTIGTPFLTKADGSGGFSPPDIFNSRDDIASYQLLVFKQILDVFKGKRVCGLYDFCKSNPGRDITSAKCLTAPWERGLKEELCPFGQLWKAWGLNGKVPKP
jgi:hypothetical protein